MPKNGQLKPARYVQGERAIARADSGGIRERWIWGLRLLNDSTAMSPNGGGLKHGVAEALIETARKAGLVLNQQEIQRRIRCAKAYPTESQMRIALTHFRTWSELVQEGFPAYEAMVGEQPFDWRTPEERSHAHARQLLAMADPQGALFPLDQFEPARATLADLQTYMVEQDGITERFVKKGQERHDYFERLERAANGDLTMTWQRAHELAEAAIGSAVEAE